MPPARNARATASAARAIAASGVVPRKKTSRIH